MRIGQFEFNLRELAGSLGDFGTFLPLAAGYIAINGMNPAGLLIMMGLVNIATAALIKEYWPDKAVEEKKLALNMGIMNTVVPFFGGMPMCHGAGGLAGQYYYGARTGGTNIIEGVIEISLGLFLSQSIKDLFSSFPMSIVGAMMILVGIELAKFIKDTRGKGEIAILIIVTVLSLFTNIGVGFLSGIILYQLLKKFKVIKIN